MTDIHLNQKSDTLKLYKFQDKIDRLESFLNQQLWLSAFSQFNDPFEGVFVLTSDPDKLKPGTPIFDHHYNYFKKHLSSDLTQEQLVELVNTAEFNEMRNKNRILIKDVFANHGAFCFASSNSNIPMWAHYSSNHEGYCVEIELNFSEINKQLCYSEDAARAYKDAVLDGRDILSFHSKIDDEIKFVLTKVQYSANAPDINLDKFLEIKDEYLAIQYIIQNSMGVKFNQWAYENEFRLIVNANSLASENQLVDLKIYAPFLRITGVIMGSKMSEANKRKCRDLCSKYKSKLYQAKCSDFKYEISVDIVEDYSTIKNPVDKTQIVEIA